MARHLYHLAARARLVAAVLVVRRVALLRQNVLPVGKRELGRGCLAG